MVSAYLLIISKPGKEGEISKKLLEYPEVKEVSIVYGEYDLIAKVEVGKITELRSFIIDRVRKLDGVDKTTTLIVAEE